MISEIQTQQLIDENQKLKTDYAILKNNFEFIEKENKELKEQVKKVKEWVKYNKYEDGCIDCDFTETDKLLEILREGN